MSIRMMNRFMKERLAGNKLFVPFISAGDRGMAFTRRAILALADAGADAIELGVPFSDPLVDGRVIQRSFQRALAQGADLEKILDMVTQVRSKTQIPLLLMGSLNLFLHPSLTHTADAAEAAGVDGFIIPDLPPEEAGAWIKLCQARELDTIFLTTPNSTPRRLRAVAEASTGYIYYVSVAGTTGVRQHLPKDLASGIQRVRHYSPLPVLVGFGIASSIQAVEATQTADGVIVGSALVRAMESGSERMALQRLTRLAREIVKSIKKK